MEIYMKILKKFVRYVVHKTMNNDKIDWENFSKARLIIDCWFDDKDSYALILHPDGVLHLQWVSLTK